MKTTIKSIVVFIILLLSQWKVVAQNPEEYPYLGGNADGSSLHTLASTTCSTPYHFFAYMGGDADGAVANNDLTTNTTCAFSNHFYAYMGGDADGSAIETIENTTCGTPFHFFAYMGGDADGNSVETLEAAICAFPPQFFAYFGGDADGFSKGETPQICPTDPPVADFTASVQEICVGSTVTFTDTSTNYPGGWNWTFAGGTPSTSTAQNPTITYNTPGVYNVTLVATNFNGNDTEVKNSYIIVYEMPTITSVTGGNSCGAGSITLSATASIGSVRWYDAPTGGNLLGTTFTPSTYQQYFATTTTYYVSALNGVCESARTPVTATVTDVPALSSTTPASRCGNGTVTLQATASTGTISWYTNATGGTALSTGTSFTTPSLSTTTTYYVEVANGTCISPRTAITATINAIPSITSTTPASRCDAGTVTLQAVASAGTISWFASATGGTALGTGTSFITPSLSTTTTYYVETTNGTCTSSRTAVTATINSTPSITNTIPAAVCNSGTVTLQASASSGTISWYASATGGTALGTGTSFTTPSISTTTTYYVEAANGTCTSTRIAVVATVNTAPMVTSTTPASSCGGASTTISATASSGIINWYNAATGGILVGTGNTLTVSGASATYYAEAVANGCSSIRTGVAYTSVAIPTITSTIPASRCDTGTLTLQATTSIGTINWYDASTGGNLVGTGNNFTTPSLSATTIYYVEADNNSCISGRTAVTATVNQQPSIIATTPASRCGDGQVTLQASSDYGTVNWYTTSTGGTPLATGTTFVTPVLGATTTYYVEAVNASCVSTRVAVTATLYVMPNITSTTPASRCDTGTVTLFAASDSGTINWYASAIGGTILATGNSFTTPSLSVTTIYYVDVTNGDCTTSRVAVTASINPTAAPTGISNQTFCAGETVDQIVVNGTSIIWYDAATGGNIIPTGTAITTGTTYYASQTLTGCESPTRFAVTMTLGSCLGNESFNLENLQVYPNPVIDKVKVVYTQNIDRVELYDVLGKIIYSNKVQNTDVEIDMTQYPTATYFLKIYADNKLKTVKLIKK